ncbi:MAG: helix-turn-helix domain-containing protein [Thermoleophilia bacterium]
MDATDTTLTVAQAADALGVSERTVWRYLKSGRLHGHTVGPTGNQRTLIAAAAVTEVQRSRRSDPEAEELRVQVARLTEQLAQRTGERDALAHRLAMMQATAVQRGVPDRILGRAAVGVASAVARLRSARVA